MSTDTTARAYRSAETFDGDDTGEKKIDPPAWYSRIVAVGDDWYTKQPPLREWLLRDGRTDESRGWLPHGKAGVIIAEGGAGKTMALTQLAIAVGKAGAWLGTFPVEKSGKVFMLLGEEEAEEAQRRIYNGHAGIGSPPGAGAIEILPMAGVDCALLMRDERGGAVETPFAGELRNYLTNSGPWALIIAEPIARIGGPDVESDTAAATRLVQVFESLIEKTGATVLGAHHTNKLGRNGAAVDANASRGATALTDGFRWVASLASRKTESLGEVVTLAVVKSNYSFKGEPLMLRRADNGRLESLSGEQRAQIEEDVTGETTRKNKAARNEVEREAKHARREEREAEKRAHREREKAAAKQAQRQLEDAALVKILRAQPGIRTDQLRAALSAEIVGGCTRDRMRDIIARAGVAVVEYTPDDGPSNARAYRLNDAQAPTVAP
jgi:RecA-family ATPase